MAEVLEAIGMLHPLHLHMPERMTDEQFFEFCQANKELRIERDAEGDILIMTPEAGSSGHGNFEIGAQFGVWARTHKDGKCFSSSTGFILPDGSMRAPDIAWIQNTRLEGVNKAEWDKFIPLCPDFVLELMSPSDRLPALQEKMAGYIKNGARMGWLLVPRRRQVHVYRPNREVEVIEDPAELSADPVLRGFRLDLPSIWAAVEGIA